MKISRGSFVFIDVEILNSNETLSVKKYHRRREALQRRAQRNEAQACGIVFRGARLPPQKGDGRGILKKEWLDLCRDIVYIIFIT